MIQFARYSTKYKHNFFKFCVVGLSGAVIQVGLTRLIFYLATTYIHLNGSNANTVSVIVAIPIIMVWNFSWNALWVWKK